MAVKLRLQRHGKKGKPFFHIVAADARAPRDGKFIERVGSYNPNTNPATIVMDNEKALNWLTNGAQPTDTVRAILSYTGVLMRQHLQKGVLKGAISQEEADKRMETWTNDKTAKVESKVSTLVKSKEDAKSKSLKHEREVNQARLKAMTNAAAEASEEAAAAARPIAEEAAPVAEVTAPVVEATIEAPVVEAAIEAPVAETPVAEAPVAEAAIEAPAVEEVPAPAETPATDVPAENPEA